MSELARFLDSAWHVLGRGTADRRSAANRPTLSTTSVDGPRARTVVLRAIDRQAGTIDIHSHALAEKVAELRLDSRAAVHVWDPKTDLQIRAHARATLHIDDMVATSAFRALPPHGRAIYAIRPDPGTALPSPEMIDFDGEPRFALIRLCIDEIELLHLDRPQHRRARFRRSDDWAGTWHTP